MAQPRLYDLRKRFQLREKIAAGYIGVLIISVGGVLLGYVAGDYFEYKSVKTAEALAESLDDLNHLEVELLQTQNSRYQLMAQSEYDLLRRYLDDLVRHHKGLQATWLTLQQYGETTPLAYGVSNPALSYIEAFVGRNGPTFNAYFYELDELTLALTSRTQIQNGENGEAAIAGLRLSEPRAIVSDVDELSEELQALIQQTRTQFKAAKGAIESTDILRFQISTGFVLLSVGAALFLIAKLSQAITAPLRSLNQVARTVTRTQNFELQAPVLTSDEVGGLATSINQLIASVHTLLQRLESKTQALTEQKVSLEKAIAALRDAQLQLVQQEKMSALGKLVAGVAHEINNPVSFIYGNIEHTNRYVEDLLTLLSVYQDCYPEPLLEVQACTEDIDLKFLSEDLPKVMQSMSMGAERIKQIVLSLRTFSRMDEAEYKSVNLHDGLDSTLVILSHRFKANPQSSAIQVTKSYGELPSVACCAGQINQVFMNIIANAIDALEESQATNAEISISTYLQAGQAVITISDNGPGITAAVQDRIFDPFFTTKAVGKGTGMGMAISYQIVVEKHHGQLLCDSSPERGTTFTVRLPLQNSNKTLCEIR